MNERSSDSEKNKINARTMRSVAAILSQTATDEALRGLNETDGRNQSEQASYLAAESPHLRDIYERGGTVVDGVLTVPRENLTASPEIEITTARAAVERLTRITNDTAKAKELAPQFVEMGERIAGSQPDGETRLKVFGWLYRHLEGKQELFEPKSSETIELDSRQAQSATQFSEKWQQIVELSEAMAALEPKDRLPENSLETLGENLQETEPAIERDEDSIASEIYETGEKSEDTERADDFVSGGILVGFERIEISADLPKIPENLSSVDFEKLLDKMSAVDNQLERGLPARKVLAPFKRYVEQTRLDNELRLVEEEYAKTQGKTVARETGELENYRFVAGREELRELAGDRLTLAKLRVQKAELTESVRNDFDSSVDREKVERFIDGRNVSLTLNNQIEEKAKPPKIELTETEAELRQLIIREKIVGREINSLDDSIKGREINFRTFAELAAERVSETRKQELLEKVGALELPANNILKAKYPELSAPERSGKAVKANTFEIRTPAEYLFVRESANRQFEVLREREIKNEYRRFDRKNEGENAGVKTARLAHTEHRENIRELKSVEPVFAYKIEGGNRIINAKPSERAVAGYDFATAYVRYQLKQPETKLRHESIVYRDFADRLEAAKTAPEVVAEAYKIRQENHRAVGVWKNADKEERSKINRPLSKNEMTLLFLEQPPKSYTAEMSVLKYNFAHYAQAKVRMTQALAEGKLEPSRDAEKLAQSLDARLNRRDTETKHKATRHFFESLKTENGLLRVKNEFDHRGTYEKLPPHEKDWIYNRASNQKENLEYKIAYERGKSANVKIESPDHNALTNETSANIRQEFAAGTLWHQAALLTAQKDARNTEPDSMTGAGEKNLRAVGFLIHNQTESGNLRVADWLEKQSGDELKTAGEILKTFAGAKREIENDQLKVTVKIAETNRVTAADYKKLFERYFPADYEKLKEFRTGENEKFRLEQSRRDGQTAMLDAWKENAQRSVYPANAPVSVFGRERSEISEIERVKQAQIECRRAVEIKNSITLKIENKLKKDFAESSRMVSGDDLRAAVETAFAPVKSKTFPPQQKEIFNLAQDKISISDFERYAENTERLEKNLAEINRSFEKIAALRSDVAEYAFQKEEINSTDSLQNRYDAARQQAEIEQINSIAREKFAARINSGDDSLTIAEYVSVEEKEQVRIESHKQARIALEPTELSAADRKSETQIRALELADALEDAHRLSLRGASQSAINDAFNAAETKREQLDESLKVKQDSQFSLENKSVTLSIYERELARNEKTIMQAKISNKVENGELSLLELETKKASEIFSVKDRNEIRLEAGERTRENLEPKELWARHGDVSEKLQHAALSASDALETAHGIYHEAGANRQEVIRAFSTLDAGIVNLKNERRANRVAAKFMNFKTDFKRDLAQMFERGGNSIENPRMLAAMTKGLLLDGLEKQNIQPEKIGFNREKLNELSVTITLAMSGEQKCEKTNFVSRHSVAPTEDNRFDQSKNIAQKSQDSPIKERKYELTR